MSNEPHNLGELELAVLKYVWDKGSSDVKTAYEAIGAARDITHNTVQSTFKRLYEKGILSRKKRGRAYIYTANHTRQELTEKMVQGLVDQVADSEMDIAVQAFVNLAEEAGEDTFQRLERLIEQRCSNQEESD